MEVQDQLVNEALSVLPELARALLAGKHRHHAQYRRWREADFLKEEDGAQLRLNCPVDSEMGSPALPHWHGPEEIPVAQIKLMSHLAMRGPRTMSELAEGLEVTTPAITGLVDKLEKRGLVERLRDSQDRRVVRVQLSGLARMIAERYIADKRRQVQSVLETLTLEEQRTFVKTLRLLAETMDPKPTAEALAEEIPFS